MSWALSHTEPGTPLQQVGSMMEKRMPTDLAQNLASFCENRKAVYVFLTRCYEREVDAGFAESCARDFSFSSDDEALNKSIESLKLTLTNMSEEKLEQLAVTFNRVFYGMGPRTAQKAFPYESVYTSSGGLMMQAAFNEVKKLYAADGFIKSPEFTEPEDHIAIELAYMTEVCNQTLDAIAQRDEEQTAALLEKQRGFLQAHMLNWAPSFVADMKGSAEEGFYWHLADFTETFLIDDLQALSEVLD